MPYAVTRQCYYYSDTPFTVEIVKGGVDFAGADMLVCKYKGEGYGCADPREALRTANMIACQWRKDDPSIDIGVTYVGLGGMGLEGEHIPQTELVEIVISEWESLPQCPLCGERQEELTWYLIDWPDKKYCSENCANNAEGEMLAWEEEIDQLQV